MCTRRPRLRQPVGVVSLALYLASVAMAVACLVSARAHASAGQPVEMQEAQPNVAVHVHVADAVGTSGGKFTCWNIDASKNRGFFDRDLDPTTPYGAQLGKHG